MQLMKSLLLGFLCLQIVGCDGNVAPNLLLDPDAGFSGVIYGMNSIQEVPAGHPNADASVALVKKEVFHPFLEKNMAYTVSEVYGIENLSWSSQPSLAFCSGFLIAEDLVLTAGHCVAEEGICGKIEIALNYDLGRLTPAMINIACKEIVKVKNDISGQGVDYALIRLEKKASSLSLKVAKEDLKKNDPIYTLGYPLGSFKKKATGVVRQILEPQGTYVANLDIFEGNSGSPVFSENTHELVGVVSGGEDDFVQDKKDDSVRHIKRCTNTGCKGEFITPIQKILADAAK